MTNFPVPLDNLITYVKSLQPEGGPLDDLLGATSVAARLDEQADALIGHFVDQARRSGASWSEIGARMGVTKQAAQKRFVPRRDGSDLVGEGGAMFSRFTVRARRSLVAAARSATGRGADAIAAADLVAGVLAEPQGLAVEVVRGLDVADARVREALGLAPTPGPEVSAADADPAALQDLEFDQSATAALKGTLKAVLRLGHNYVGTEHLLLGVLFAGGPTSDALGRLGLTVDSVEAGIAAAIERIQQERKRA